MIPIRVLISLYKGYGLGDAVQMSAVLRHLAKHRRNWLIDFQAEEGQHQIGRGIVDNTFAYGTPYPSAHYAAESHIVLYDTWYGLTDRPNTRVSSCLRETFDLEWDASCGQYQINVSDKSIDAVNALLYYSGGNRRQMLPRRRYVAIHYQGDSAQDKKNLTHEQAYNICRAVEKLGYGPLILDWRNRSKIPYRRLTNPAAWGKDAEMVCAVISRCAAFIGIDSGPAKCASATDVPSLVIWTGHHPAPFHDPADNTTHLVPTGYHGLHPVNNNLAVAEWFDDHYKVRTYNGDLVKGVEGWLGDLLRPNKIQELLK